MQTAIDRYGWEFLAGFYVDEAEPFEAWAVVLRERLHHLATQTLQRLATYFVDRSETGPGLRYTNQWLALEPWREEAHRHKLRLLVWDGQSQAALAHYERCRAVLAAELGAEPEAETVALYEEIRHGHLDSVTTRQADLKRAHSQDRQGAMLPSRFLLSALPARPLAATPPHNLPSLRTPLIGREAEVAQLCRMVSAPPARLVTLVGPGGVGKTQVALAAAQTILANGLVPESATFSDGIWFVPLTGVTVGLPDPEVAVISAILQALQVTPVGATSPRQHLVNAVGQKSLLLVLDHFDHLRTARPLLTWLLQTAPHLCLLVTAQIPLGLAAEVVAPLAGLPVPEHENDPQALAYGSVSLFRERAGRAWPVFAPTGDTLRAIIHICRLVEGVPLHIELVAGWSSHLSYGQIAQDIDKTLSLLENSVPGPGGYQPNSQAVCEFVWQRLMPAEQGALAGATIFQGSFSRAAFLAVTKARLTDLMSLHDRGLLQQEGIGRYLMPERVHHFASQKLATELGGGEEVRNRHAEYYANFLQACEPELKTEGQHQTLAAIQLDIHNIYAMWQRTVQLLHLPMLEKAQESLWSFYGIQGRYWEGEALFAAAATALIALDASADQHAGIHALALGQVLSWQGWCQLQMGRFAEALDVLQQSLAHFAQASERMHRTMAYAHLAAGQIHLVWDEPTHALTHLRQGLTHAQECGDPWGSAYCTFLLGPLILPVRQYKRLAVHYQESLATWRRLGDPRLLIDGLVLCADTAIYLGEYEQTEGYLQESQQLSQAHDLPVGLLATHLVLCEFYRVRGQDDEAKAISAACLQRSIEMSDARSRTTVLHTLGLLAAASHAYDEAKQYLQESLRLAQQSSSQAAVIRALTALGALEWQLGNGEQARATQEKSYALAQQLPLREDLVATALGGLAAVNTALAAHAAAETNYQQALTCAVQTQAPPLILELLVGLAALRFKTGGSTPERIADWLALAYQHPASTKATKVRAAQLLAEVPITAPVATQASIPIHHQEQDWMALLTTIFATARQNSAPTIN